MVVVVKVAAADIYDEYISFERYVFSRNSPRARGPVRKITKSFRYDKRRS